MVRWFLVAPLLVVALGTGCGDDEGKADPSPSAGVTETVTPTPTETTPALKPLHANLLAGLPDADPAEIEDDAWDFPAGTGDLHNAEYAAGDITRVVVEFSSPAEARAFGPAQPTRPLPGVPGGVITGGDPEGAAFSVGRFHYVVIADGGSAPQAARDWYGALGSAS